MQYMKDDIYNYLSTVMFRATSIFYFIMDVEIWYKLHKYLSKAKIFTRFKVTFFSFENGSDP